MYVFPSEYELLLYFDKQLAVRVGIWIWGCGNDFVPVVLCFGAIGP